MRDNLDTIRQFCEAFSRKDLDEILEFFSDDAVYHNMPMAPVQGKAAIKTVLDMFLKPAQAVEFAILNDAASRSTTMSMLSTRWESYGTLLPCPSTSNRCAPRSTAGFYSRDGISW